MSSIFKGLFGGRSSAEKVLQQFNPVGFSSPAMAGKFNKDTNSFDLTRTAEGNTAIEDLISGFQKRGETFKGLADRVRPGFGELTRTTVDAIRRAGTRSVGNLREELSKRRVVGSSFAQREIAGVEAEFGELEKKARAESKIAELDMTAEFLGESTQAAIDSAAQVMTQLNFESNLSAGLSEAAGAQINANITAQAEARAAQEEGAGGFLGTILGAVVGGPIGGIIGEKLFGD